MCNLEKRLISATFWVLLQAMFMKDWKQTAQRLKLRKRLLTIIKRDIIRWKKAFKETAIFIHEDKYSSVSKNPESLSLCFKPASQCLLFSKMNSRQENRSKFSSYSQIYNWIFFGTFSFYLRWENISKGFLKFCKLISNLILGQIIVSNLTNVHN